MFSRQGPFGRVPQGIIQPVKTLGNPGSRNVLFMLQLNPGDMAPGKSGPAGSFKTAPLLLAPSRKEIFRARV
jgi:hypothetical protein